MEKQPIKTLRDEFAMSAVMGLIRNTSGWGLNMESIAKDAYKLADALLKQREL